MSLPATETVEHRSLPDRLRSLDGDELLFETKLLARGEHAMTICMLHHLNEIWRRRLYLERGCSSLFDYCVRGIGYTESAAGRRIAAARCIRRHPEVLELLQARELGLSTVSLIEPVLDDANKDEILERVRGRSHREVERVLCEYRPPVRFRDRVRPVRVAVPTAMDVDEALVERDLDRVVPPEYRVTPGAGSATTERKLHVQFLADEELMEKFEQARALVSHRCGGSFGEVLAFLLNDFLDRRSPAARKQRREEREQRRKKNAPRSESRAGGQNHSRRREWEKTQSRHIPADVRDRVFSRDCGRCTFRARDGSRCGSRHHVQVDHIRPFAAGGTHDISNLRLLCAAHNRLAAERALGADAMREYWRRE